MVSLPTVITGYHGGIITYSITVYQRGMITYSYYRVSEIRVVLLPTVITGYQGGIITYSCYSVLGWYYCLQLLQKKKYCHLLQLLHGIRVVLLPTVI